MTLSTDSTAFKQVQPPRKLQRVLYRSDITNDEIVRLIEQIGLSRLLLAWNRSRSAPLPTE